MFTEIKRELRFYTAAGRLLLKHPGGTKYIGYLLKIRKAQRKIRRLFRTRRPTSARKGAIDIDQLGALYGLKRVPGETDAAFRERLEAAVFKTGENVKGGH